MIREPLPLLYNNGAVLSGLVYSYLPFVVLPLFATLERLEPVCSKRPRTWERSRGKL